MATIAEQLTSLANTKTAIKDAIVAKGVTVVDTDPFSAYPDKIGQIQAGGGEVVNKTKFGASIDTWIGDVDENGVLQKTTWTGALIFSGVKEIGSAGLHYAFRNRTGITSVDLSSVQSIGASGMYYAFYRCTGITGALDLSSLQSIDSNGMYYAFDGCTGITSVDLSSLQSIDSNGMYYAFVGCTGITSVDLSSVQSIGSNGMYYAFDGCRNITSVNLSSLQTVGSNALIYAFRNCKKLTAISFPSLTSVQTNSFASSTSNGAFRDCTALAEIHFRADMQATIEAMTGYSNKWGATSSTIYFDL